MNFYMHRLDPKRRDSGYWEDFENLKQELMSVVSGDPASHSEHDSLQDAASLAANAGEEGNLPQNALDGNPFFAHNLHPSSFLLLPLWLPNFRPPYSVPVPELADLCMQTTCLGSLTDRGSRIKLLRSCWACPPCRTCSAAATTALSRPSTIGAAEVLSRGGSASPAHRTPLPAWRLFSHLSSSRGWSARLGLTLGLDAIEWDQ